MPLGPPEVKALVRGLMAFVCTPFTPSSHLDLERFREHLRTLVRATTQKPAACFVCCGTGEFFSLNMAEYRLLVRAAVEEVGSEVPVFAGTGYGTRMAIEFAVTAEEQGADGVLVFPPYLVSAPQEGLYLHCRVHCGSGQSERHPLQPRQRRLRASYGVPSGWDPERHRYERRPRGHGEPRPNPC